MNARCLKWVVVGLACEMDVKEDGTIINIEREIKAKDLPKAVIEAVEKKYPKSTLKEIMEIMAMKDKKEVLEGYEIVLDGRQAGGRSHGGSRRQDPIVTLG